MTTITEKLTPKTYELIRIGLQREGADVVALADLRIRNAADETLMIDNPSTTLTPSEKSVLAAFVNRELALFEASSGLTEWVPPPPPEPPPPD